MNIFSGGFRISKTGGANPKGLVPTKCFPKTAWKWRKLDREGGGTRRICEDLDPPMILNVKFSHCGCIVKLNSLQAGPRVLSHISAIEFFTNQTKLASKVLNSDNQNNQQQNVTWNKNITIIYTISKYSKNQITQWLHILINGNEIISIYGTQKPQFHLNSTCVDILSSLPSMNRYA